MIVHAENVGTLWLELLGEIYHRGTHTSPRGINIRELTGVGSHLVYPTNNIFRHPARGLSYRFLVAEWLWIWFGHDDVATISKYNGHIAKFSDNGVDFNGSYGVPIKRQWPYVEALLKKDPDTRQAVIDIFAGREARNSKDVPCTLSIQFLIRGGALNTVVTMRSQDMILGFPYDAFNFTMLANIMAAIQDVRLGWLKLNVGSAHIYESNFELVKTLLGSQELLERITSPRFTEAPPEELHEVLMDPANTLSAAPGEWGYYAEALMSPTSAGALDALRRLSCR